MELTGPQEELAKGMADRICKVQQQIAGYLNDRTACVGKRIWLLALAVLCLLMGGYCAYLVIDTLN